MEVRASSPARGLEVRRALSFGVVQASVASHPFDFGQGRLFAKCAQDGHPVSCWLSENKESGHLPPDS